MVLKFLLFFLLNFGALALGGLFTGEGVPSEWYQNLNQAPWTPPGWVFGAAWTSIMVCFTFYMVYAYRAVKKKKILIVLYALQWVLNVSWNPAFFYAHNVLLGFILICSLTFLVGIFLIMYRQEIKSKSLLILPYFVWLLIATSLNAYILIYN